MKNLKNALTGIVLLVVLWLCVILTPSIAGAASITVTDPDGSEPLYTNSTYDIEFYTLGLSGSQNIYLLSFNGCGWEPYMTITQNVGSGFAWKVTAPAGTKYKIKVCNVSNPTICDESNPFDIVYVKNDPPCCGHLNVGPKPATPSGTVAPLGKYYAWATGFADPNGDTLHYKWYLIYVFLDGYILQVDPWESTANYWERTAPNYYCKYTILVSVTARDKWEGRSDQWSQFVKVE